MKATEKRDAQHGFSMVELLVVVAIIGFLAAVALPAYASYKQQSCDAMVTSDLHSVSAAMEAYFVTEGTYEGATVPDLETDYHYRHSPDVTVSIETADRDHYVLTASVPGGSGLFTYDSTGGSITGPTTPATPQTI
jgi:prepilin-type N-terminal cleavage/methylation domain-containing protein